MRPPTPPAMGWPFLVASGRRRDYSILLAPDFLVADLDYGILEEVVSPTSERDQATVIQVQTRAGRRLTLVYATHLLSAADIARAGTATGTSTSSPRDEHNRPLRLIYGFVDPDTWIPEPAPADLNTAREAALDVYRRFLHDEENFTVVPAPPFPIRSRTTAPTLTAPTHTAPTHTAPTHTAATVPPVRTPPPQPVTASTSRPAHLGITPRPRRALWLTGAATIIGLGLAGAIWVAWSPPSPPPPPCPSVAAVASTNPSPPAPSTASSPRCGPSP